MWRMQFTPLSLFQIYTLQELCGVIFPREQAHESLCTWNKSMTYAFTFNYTNKY